MPGSQCRYCGETSVFWKVIAGRPVIYNADGSPHRCKSQVVAPQYGGTPAHIKGKRIVGPGYKPVAHAAGCEAAPWEECSCAKVAV